MRAPHCHTKSHELPKRRVCVIGAGAGGLVACKELVEQGLEVVVYESAECVGGTWVFKDIVSEGKRLSEDNVRDTKATTDVENLSSMYDSLHTNLPTDLMCIPGFAMGRKPGTLRFPHHTVVRSYLNDYREEYELDKYIQLNTTVSKVEYIGDKTWCSARNSCNRVPDRDNLDSVSQYKVSIIRKYNVDGPKGMELKEVNESEFFNSIVVANGHYSLPNLPGGLVRDTFKKYYKGLVIHSHSYRRPDPFVGKRVAVVGGGPSGRDIARDIAQVCEHVYMCANVKADSFLRDMENLTVCGRLKSVNASGEIQTEDSTSIGAVDVVILCTGYKYYTPFFDGTALQRVSANGRYVERLYLHIFDIDFPSVAYMGIPYHIVPFLVMDYQAKLVARVYSGAVSLPSHCEMESERRNLETSCRQIHETVDSVDEYDCLARLHDMNSGPKGETIQFNYCDALADMCNSTRGECNPAADEVPHTTIEQRRLYEAAAKLRLDLLGY
eukprot:CFRG6601T1